MNKSFIIIAGLLVLFGAYSYWVKGNVQGGESLAYSRGDQFQSFSLPSMNGEEVELRDIIANNKMTWINFWATWCGPCRREMPMMADLYNKYKDKGLGMVAISIGESPETVRQYLDEYPVPFPVLTDPDQVQTQSLHIEVLPTSFLVDSTGSILQVGTGVQNSWSFLIQTRLDNE